MSERPIDESESSSLPLLPTPAAQEDGKTPDQHMAMKAALPGGPRNTITSLAVLARADFRQPELLPTPGANDYTGGEGPTRLNRQERSRGVTGGPALRDIEHLLPTPMSNMENPGAGGELRAALTHGPGRRNETGTDTWGRPNKGRTPLLPTPTSGDAKSSGSRNLEGSKANPGVSLTDAILYGNSTTPRLLPTPTGDDANNNAGPAQHERNSLPLNTVASIASHGAHTEPPSSDGKRSSDGPLPGQLTIEDA